MMSGPALSHKSATSRIRRITLLHIVATLAGIGFCIGAIMAGKALVESSRLSAQVSQIAEYDEAVANFYTKFDGMPGDLIYVAAQRSGFDFGDGTPGHGDGDGKISPCSLGWQWNLGCETALFWAHLSSAQLIQQNFAADGRLRDYRLMGASIMDPYLPRSPLGDGMYVTVWNTDATQPSPGKPLPYGNYFEISKIDGISRGKIQDDPNAMTPAQARAIDQKIDDGYPLSGRVVANGTAEWPKDAWGSYAVPGDYNCVSEDHIYNIYDPTKSNVPLCHIAISFNCCTPKESE